MELCDSITASEKMKDEGFFMDIQLRPILLFDVANVGVKVVGR